jgi:hypothetical protein
VAIDAHQSQPAARLCEAPRTRYRLAVQGEAAVGLVPHTGWAWLVRVRGTADQPVVDLRERVVACDVLEGELYHLAAERSRDRERFVAGRRARALRQAGAAIAAHVAGARRAVVLGKTMALPPLERIVAAHPLIHGAEGELWRAVFAEACDASGLAVVRCEAGRVREALGSRHRPAEVAAFLAAGKRAVGAPWNREPQDAALAAWSALTGAVGDGQ